MRGEPNIPSEGEDELGYLLAKPSRRVAAYVPNRSPSLTALVAALLHSRDRLGQRFQIQKTLSVSSVWRKNQH